MRFESKHTNTKILTVEGDLVTLSSPSTTYPSTVFDEMGYRRANLEGKNLMVTQEVIEQHFEPVENFVTLEFYTDFIEYHYVYMHKSEKFAILVDKNLSSDWRDEDVVEHGVYKLSTVYYDMDNASEIRKHLNELISIKLDFSKEITVVIKTNAGFSFKQLPITPLDISIEDMYNDDFEQVHEHLVHELQHGTKGIALLHGTPGTGKTNYIKWLTTQVPNKRFIFVSPNLVPYLADPSFLEELLENKKTILVLEDCENYIKDRSEQNDVVSTVLNITDGILSDLLEIQVLCTFNTDLYTVDKALLREGRLIVEYKFDPLVAKKAAKLLEEDVDEEMTLAQIFNKTTMVRKNTNRTQIGFG